MQPKPSLQKKGCIINNQNKFAQSHKPSGFTRKFGQPVPPLAPRPNFKWEKKVPTPAPIPKVTSAPPINYQPPEPQPQYQPPEQPPQYQPPPQSQPILNYQPPTEPLYQPPSEYNYQPQTQQRVQQQPPLYPNTPPPLPDTYNPYQTMDETGFEPDLTSEQIEQSLTNEDRQGHLQTSEDEREFVGGKKLYDRQLMQQPMYDEPTMQILNDIASDESFPILVQYITQLSHLGRQAQARLIARASAFQSKNQVFSNIQNQNDYMMAQDDYTYAQIMSKCDYSTYDTNADYFTAEAIMEAQFNIRLRRSRNALNLLQINTQRQESIMSQHPAQEEERKLRSKIPFLGQFTG